MTGKNSNYQRYKHTYVEKSLWIIPSFWKYKINHSYIQHDKEIDSESLLSRKRKNYYKSLIERRNGESNHYYQKLKVIKDNIIKIGKVKQDD